MCDERRVPLSRPRLLLEEAVSFPREALLEEEVLGVEGGPRVVWRSRGRRIPRVVEQKPSRPAGPYVSIDGEITQTSSLEEALLRARAAYEEGRSTNVYDADDVRYDGYDVDRLTDVLPDGTIRIVDPREDPWWDEWCHYQKNYAGLEYLMMHKDALGQAYAYAILGPAAVRFIAAALGPRAVSMGEGTGYVARQLARWGTVVDAYDIRPPGVG